MTPGVWESIGGVGGFLVMAVTLYLNFLRPKSVLRGRVIDKLVGHDGRDGLPKEKSIFERLDDIAATQATQQQILERLAEEFPKNGIPTRAAVDRIADDLRRAQTREDQRWATLSAALLAQNIKIPSEG